MKRTDDGERVFSVDLLTPRLGETSGGAVREEETSAVAATDVISRVNLGCISLGSALADCRKSRIRQSVRRF